MASLRNLYTTCHLQQAIWNLFLIFSIQCKMNPLAFTSLRWTIGHWSVDTRLDWIHSFQWGNQIVNIDVGYTSSSTFNTKPTREQWLCSQFVRPTTSWGKKRKQWWGNASSLVGASRRRQGRSFESQEFRVHYTDAGASWVGRPTYQRLLWNKTNASLFSSYRYSAALCFHQRKYFG